MAKNYFENTLTNENETVRNIELYYFGPMLYATKLPLDFCKELADRGRKKLNPDHRPHLAGHLEEERKFQKEDMIWFLKETHHHFEDYIARASNHSNAGIPSLAVDLDALWINYMKKHEYNPIHTHDGSMSFVIYCDVPPEIEEDSKKRNIGRHHGPGSIDFYYGDKMILNRDVWSFYPVTGDFLIFPAWLKHAVWPYYIDKERVSVSGNLKLIKPDGQHSDHTHSINEKL